MGVYTRIYPKLVFQTIYGNADGKTQPTVHQQHRRSKTQTTKQRSQTQANTPKLPITWTIYRPLKQTCHAGIQYAHPNSRAVYPPGLTYLSRSKLLVLRYTYVCKLARTTGQLCKLGHAHSHVIGWT